MNTPWVEVVGWALVDSLWTGLAVAAGLALTLLGLRRASPRARYVACCVALAAMVVWPAARAIPASRVGATPAPDPAGRVAIVSNPEAAHSSGDPPSPTPSQRLRPVLPAAVAAWLAGVALLGLRLLGGWALAGSWKIRGARAVDAARLGRIRRLLHVDRAVALLESARVEVPTVIGWIRPAILLPASALSGLDPLELDAILAHELAHIRRHDYLINLVQCLVETLLFYHPAAWWVSRAIRREREHCCDDLAVLACGDPLLYARALATMEGLRGPAIPLALAASGGGLLARIRRILNNPEPKENPMKLARMLGCFAVVVALAPVVLAARFTLEDGPSPKPSSSASRAYADIVTNVDEVPTGRLMFGVGPQAEPARESESGGMDTDARLVPHGSDQARRPTGPGEVIDEEANIHGFTYPGPQQPAPSSGQAAAARPSGKADDRQVPATPRDCPTCLDPPTEAEVWERVAKFDGKAKALPDNPRNHVRILIEKVGETIDPVKVYPLAGPCELVHCRYKATVFFDETYFADKPIPSNHKKARTEVVLIDKEHLRRAAKPAEAVKESAAEKIERLSREVEDLNKLRERYQKEYEQAVERLRKEKAGEEDAGRKPKTSSKQDDEMRVLIHQQLQLKQLQLQLRPEKQTDAGQPSKTSGALDDREQADASAYFSFFLGAFW